MLLLSLTLTGCTPATSPEPGRIEGTEPGDCSDGADNDADGMFDCEDDSCAGSSDCVASDSDGDGYTTADGDCDDADATLNPADADGDGVSSCDGDCDDANSTATLGAATAEPSLCTTDADGDGYGDVNAAPPLDAGTDCDDLDAAAHPESAAAEPGLCTTDADGDGYGDVSAAPPLDAGTDCDDTNPGGHPAAADSEPGLCTIDADGDGYGDVNAAAPLEAGTDCDDADASLTPADDDGDTFSSCSGDCDDSNDDAYPGGDDMPFVDGDCDGRSMGNLIAADHHFTGAEEYDLSGRVSGAGDVDGDGLADLLFGGTYTEHAYLFVGAGLSSTTHLSLDDADHRYGEYSTLSYPGRVSSAGDVDGDGLDDVLIGAYGYFETHLVFSDDLDQLNYTIEGSSYSGLSTASAGDIDGDGYDDIIIGSTSEAYILRSYNILSTQTQTIKSPDYVLADAAESVDGVGDLDGDGYDDVLVAAIYEDIGGAYPGAAAVFLGGNLDSTTSHSVSTADYYFTGERDRDVAGHSVAGAGDVDGDGIPDLLIGAPGYDTQEADCGQAYLILGDSLGSTATIDLYDADHHLTGEESGDEAGVGVDGAGDVDGDGLADLLIGSNGQAYLVLGGSLGSSGTLSLSEADHTFLEEVQGDEGGTMVSGAGDVNGDGRDDILIGAPFNDETGENAGKSYLLFGPI